jgi:hypothetical protein
MKPGPTIFTAATCLDEGKPIVRNLAFPSQFENTNETGEE